MNQFFYLSNLNFAFPLNRLVVPSVRCMSVFFFFFFVRLYAYKLLKVIDLNQSKKIMEQNNEPIFSVIPKKSTITDDDRQRLLNIFKRMNTNIVWSKVENFNDFHAERFKYVFFNIKFDFLTNSFFSVCLFLQNWKC